jgi:ElaB/YqjD/DUF883 family membrane-anchored ribosome-binding protein
MNTMETAARSRPSILGLIRGLSEDTKKLLRQELELAKAELTEKFSLAARNAVSLAIGGFVAYAGLIVLLMGLGWLVAWALEKAGLQPLLAGFVGLAIVGVVVMGVGGIFLMKGIKTFAKESLAPQRTIHTIQKLKGSAEAVPVTEERKDNDVPKPSSEQLQARVEATETRMGDTLDELGQRLSPSHINAQVKQRIQEKPYRSGLLAMGAGILSGFFLTRSSRHS